MKTNDMILIGAAAVAAYLVFDVMRISDRFYLSDAENARININLARGWGLIPGDAAAAYHAAIANGTADPKMVTAGLMELERAA